MLCSDLESLSYNRVNSTSCNYRLYTLDSLRQGESYFALLVVYNSVHVVRVKGCVNRYSLSNVHVVFSVTLELVYITAHMLYEMCHSGACGMYLLCLVSL